jgi:rubrerythrin
VPEFVNPFSGKVPERPLTKEELIRAIRLDIAAEHEATHLYMAHAEAIDDPVARAVLIDIANEERVHVGEFMRLLSILTGDEDQWLAQGAAEVDELAAAAGTAAPLLAAQVATAEASPSAGQTPPAGAEPTLGSLRQ